MNERQLNTTYHTQILVGTPTSYYKVRHTVISVIRQSIPTFVCHSLEHETIRFYLGNASAHQSTHALGRWKSECSQCYAMSVRKASVIAWASTLWVPSYASYEVPTYILLEDVTQTFKINSSVQCSTYSGASKRNHSLLPKSIYLLHRWWEGYKTLFIIKL